jgi:hypothetical protein
VQNINPDAFENIQINNELGRTELTGGGGGGTSTQPIVTDTNGSFKVYLISEEAAEYFEGNKSIGIGISQTIEYTPSTSFGSERTYTSKIDNKVAKNYFVVFLNKEFRGYNAETGEQTYYESIRASEYRLKSGSQTEYQFYEYKNLNGVTGTIELPFLFERKRINPPDGDIIIIPTKNYEFTIDVNSNYLAELEDVFSVHYQIVNSNTNVITGSILLSNPNTDKISLSEEILNNSKLVLSLAGVLPQYFSFDNIKVGTISSVDRTISLDASIIKRGNVNVELLFSKNAPQPVVSTIDTQYNGQVKDSDSDKVIEIPFTTSNANSINVTFPNGNVRNITTTSFTVSFKNDLGRSFDLQKLILTPVFDNILGASKEVFVKFARINNTPDIVSVSYPASIDIPAFSDYNIEYEVKYEASNTTYVKVELLQKDNTKIIYLDKLTPIGSFKVNIKSLKEQFINWEGNVSFIFTAINNGGDVTLSSNTYSYTTNVIYPTIKMDENLINTSLFNAFKKQVNIPDLDRDSKYLTHLANFGDDNQFLVSSWENDDWTLSKKSIDELGNEFVRPEDKVESLILKLYKPLSANITNNSTLWITKLLTNPLIETIVLNQQDDLKCPPLKGPNFNVEVDFVTGKSTGYESLDDLILSGSTSSAQLVNKYLSGSVIDTEYLNIEYTSGSEYLWENFVHFSSATERVDNFVYKVKLIELYEQLIISASTNYTGGSSGSYTGSISSLQEVDRQNIKKNQIIQSFDGFETFLYTSSSLSWPYNGDNRLLSSDTQSVEPWYDNLISLAEDFDIENRNWINNNIPQYIVNNEDNASLLLFFSMIGQHFDNIYFHTKAIEKSRGLGYKQTGNISDKLLFDILKSFNWDAKNLAADNQLWSLVFGVDKAGDEVNSNPAKQRNFEVWRRIVNNLPYLLKHKGTRQGIYALLACYGIPSSNLSVLEFGGPEVTDNTKNKLIYDNTTSALKFYGQNSGSIKLEWKNTERNRKPDTIECFVKPAYSGNFNIISGSGWGVNLIGSTDSKYGKVVFNYSGSYEITSSLLPIFNDGFFGIEVSRNSGSVSSSFELNVRQSNKERTIFQQSVSASILNVSASWDNGNYIYIASGSAGYSGSLDEFRLWSTPLDKERFYEHVSFPEMVNGNHISASTDDLFFRLDFEYPKNLAVSSSLLNVDTNIYFSSSLYRNDLESGSITNGTLIFSENPSASYSASAIGFPSLINYPFQFEAIDRTVVLEIPDVGSGRYSTNKIRFESQTLVSDLSSKGRATKKAFDQSPTDSNRVGLFFSPTKELNIDIAKSFGGINLDNYIGDPIDEYKSNYTRLDELRQYYFQRFDNRDIYAYINLIKLYEKSMFEDIKKMLPARVKATTGLLIEPHILERSKIARKRPIGEEYQLDTEIKYSDTTLTTAENNQYESIIDANLSENLIGENNQYESLISTTDTQRTIAENYQYTASYVYFDDTSLTAENLQYEVSIDAKLEEPTITTEIDLGVETYGETAYETIGFGIYAQNGNTIRTYLDKDNRRVKERIRVQLITEEKERMITKFAVTASATGFGDPRGGYVSVIETYNQTYLNIQPFSGSTIPTVQNNIVAVVPVNGYLPTHYRNTSDLTRGLENSFFRGSKNTAATTLDGSSPIEIFVSNPNTLTVNRTGRNTSEPILEVE